MFQRNHMIMHVRIIRFDYSKLTTESKNDLTEYEFPSPTVQQNLNNNSINSVHLHIYFQK